MKRLADLADGSRFIFRVHEYGAQDVYIADAGRCVISGDDCREVSPVGSGISAWAVADCSVIPWPMTDGAA